MRLRSGIFAVLLSILFPSCSPQEQGGGEGEDVFTVRFDALSSELGKGVKERWQPGDRISINGYAYEAEAAGAEVAFKPVSTPAPKASRYVAVYPATFGVDGTTASGTLSGSINQSNNPESYPPFVQAAGSAGKTLILKNLLSYVSVDVMAAGVQSVTFGSNGDEQLCGAFSVDCSGSDPTISVTGGSNEVKVTAASGSFTTGTTVLIPTLPRTLKSGLTVTFTFDSSHGGGTWSASLSDHTVLYRAKLLSLGEFQYSFETGIGRLRSISGITAAINCAKPLSEPVSKMLFCSFSEVHGGDMVPGICEQYIVNSSMETWDGTGDLGESKNELVFTGGNAPAVDDDVAYPWEKRLTGSGSSVKRSSTEHFNTEWSQCLTAAPGATAALLQKIALPMYRVSKYKVAFYAKAGSADVSLKASIHDVSNKETTVLSNEFTPTLTVGSWTRYECEFSVNSSSSIHNNRYNQFNLWLEASGSGSVWVDLVTIFPSDCIEGIFNPETLAYFKQYKVQGIRWPGGNYTSGYNWKNGIGPRDRRKSLKLRAWGGMDSNICGTDEFMRFCELTGIEPVMGVGYNRSLLPADDVAAWVEYCNGPATSTYGAMRAANGHPEPYNVKYWGIGNEVYGTYQLGHEDAASYASGLSEMSDKMRAVDPGIKILASGQAVHNAYRGNYNGWTETVYSNASSKFDLFDCHMYVYGNATSNNPNLDGESWFRVFAAANLNLRKFIDNFRTIAPGKKLAMLEWGVLPSIAGTNHTPQRQTFANLLLSALEWHEMIRNSDVFEMAAFHNFSFYISPQTLHSEPVNYRTNLYKELSPLAGGYCVPVDNSTFPTYNQERNILDIGVQKNVPEIDIAAVLKDGFLYLSCVNSSPSEQREVSLKYLGVKAKAISGNTYTATLPYAKNLWSQRFECTVVPAATNGTMDVTLPPLSYTMLKITVEQ